MTRGRQTIKSKHSLEIPLKSMNVTFCHSSCQRSATLCCSFDQSGVAVAGATNAANMRRREDVTVSLFFPPPHPHAINPTTPTHGYFVFSSVLPATRDQDGGPSNRQLRSHGKIGDCEQSRVMYELYLYWVFSCISNTSINDIYYL